MKQLFPPRLSHNKMFHTMRVLVKESLDKQTREILNISKDELLEKLKSDYGYHEVITGFDHNTIIRVYFDIDDIKDVLEDLIKRLCEYFSCEKHDWAISCGSREGKVSYHILSRKYSISIKNLRNIQKELGKEFRGIDTTCLYFSMIDASECVYLRFPNQSKDGVNKPAPPMKIIQGEMEDFLITEFTNLTPFVIPS